MDALPALQELARRANSIRAQVERLEAESKRAKGQLNEILQSQMPEIMAGAGMALGDSIEVEGVQYKLEEYISGTWPKDPHKAAQAEALLDEYEAGDLLKVSVVAEFGRSGHNEAYSLVAELADRGLKVGSKAGVHPQTLRAFARERLAAGEQTDLATLGLDSGLHVKVKANG